MAKQLTHLLPCLLALALMLPAAGYRHLWQDEVDTAERARSVLSSGLPRIYDPEGRVSVHTGGAEIEDGDLHRYQPWIPFYAGAGGLWLGKILGWSEDVAIRSPFIFSHAATLSLISVGLNSVAGWPIKASVLIAGLAGAQSSRILYNRTARYHALLDLLFVAGMLMIGLSRRHGRQRWRDGILAVILFSLPHVQTFGGIVSALILLSLCRAFLVETFKDFAVRRALPFALSVLLLIALSRFWLQGEWHAFVERGPLLRSLWDFEHIAYALVFYVAVLAWMWRRCKDIALPLSLLLAGILVNIAVFDLHSFSQTRYYLTLPLFFLFWPIAVPMVWPKNFWTIWIAVLLSAELAGPTPAFHGLRVLTFDARGGTGEQPLREALDWVAEHGQGDAVLIDYVPQFVNWYLRTSPVALMPDLATRDALNFDNPVWRPDPPAPQWHIWYPEALNGPWRCANACDYVSEGYSDESERYAVRSGRLKRTFTMCIVKRWKTDYWNNAPFAQELEEALTPSGKPRATLVLAKRCDE